MTDHPPTATVTRVSSGTPKGHRPPTSRIRRWIFRLLAMTLVPAAFLVLLEISLHLFGFGYSTAFFVPADERSAMITNENFGWRFFPKQIARGPVMRSIDIPKPGKTIRVMVLGASAAQGYPDTSFGFPRILEAMLSESYPKTNFQVINTGVAAINSHAVRLIAKDVAKLQPDLFIIYLGNNEIVGPYGPGTVFAGFTPNRTFIQLSLSLKSTRIGQWIEHLAKPSPTDSDDLQEWQGMKMFTKHRIAAQDERLPAVYEHFRANLEAICATGEDAGADVILSTVAVNLRDHAPFSSEHRPDLSNKDRATWESLLEKGSASAAAKNDTHAVELFNQALAIDDQHAGLHFRLAQSLENTGEVQQAKQHYQLARDLDTLRFRADSRINAIIRETATSVPTVKLVDAEKVFESSPLSVNSITGAEHFHEHVHLNFEGNYLLASSLFPAVVESLSSSVRQQSASTQEPPSLQASAKAVGYTLWDKRRIANDVVRMTAQAPFTLQFNHDAQHRLRREKALKNPNSYRLTKASAKTCRQAMEANPEDLTLKNQLAFILFDLGQYDQAVALWQEALDEFPEFTLLSEQLNEAKAVQFQFNKARDQRLQATKQDPANYEHPNNLGILYHQHKRYDEAIDHYRKALTLKSDDPTLYYNLAITMMAAQREEEALAAYYHAIQIKPDFYQVQHNLANALQQMGRIEESLTHYQKTIDLRPDHYIAHRNYALALRSLKRYDLAIEHLETAMGLNPDYHQAQHDLDETIRMKY